MRHCLPFLAVLVLPLMLCGQQAHPDSAFSGFLFKVHYSYQVPGGDLGKRFGDNSNVGAGLSYKTKQNWLFGLGFDFLFGSKVKEDGILKNISTGEGYVIDGNGTYAEIYLMERAYYFSGNIGKVVPFSGKNRNNGILISTGGGYFMHKILIDNPDKAAPQVQGDYKRGYDRLCGGFGINEFIGFIYFGKSKVFNFYGGLEFNQAWTKNLREFNFDTQTHNSGRRFEALYGLRAGWIIPFRKRSAQVFYYY